MHLGRVFLISAFLLSACGGNKSTAPTTVTLLDTTVALPAGQICSVGSTSRDFNGTANTRVTVTATGAGLTLRAVLYAPDFATQLAVATSASPASITMSLTQTGTHHVSFCEVNGLAGNVSLTVTQN